MGLSAMLRPNNIGIQILICGIIVVSDIWKAKITQAIQDMFLMAAGVLLVLAPIFSFFIATGTFKEFINATFIFNFLYTNGLGFSDPIAIPLFILVLGWPCWLAVFGWFILLWDIRTKVKTLPAAISCLLLIGLPAEIFLDTISGRPYLHYVIMLLPYIGFLSAFFLYRFASLIKTQNTLMKTCVGMVLISAMLFSLWCDVIYSKWGTGELLSESSEIISFIKANTSKSQYVLVWGQELSINLLSERESPTPYGFQTFFLYDSAVTPRIVQIFFSKLEKNKPTLVIITDALPFLENDPVAFDAQIKSLSPDAKYIFRAFSEYVLKNYHKIKTIQNYQVYSLNK
jgi:hypothetical protein